MIGSRSEVLAAWNLRDLRDTNQPEAIIKQGTNYQLAPGFKIASIEYMFDWNGMGNDVFNYEKIHVQGGGYIRDQPIYVSGSDKNPDHAGPVKNENVIALVNAIRNLHPAMSYLGGSAHTDDYPSWDVLIIGQDGSRLSIESISTGNPGFGPWNFYSNGQIYAQYDGSVGAALNNLFPSEPSTWVAHGEDPNSYKDDIIHFNAYGMPNEVDQGIDGLLPVSHHLSIKANQDAGTIDGTISGQYSHLTIGGFTHLSAVSLTSPDRPSVRCTTTIEAAGSLWHFSCPVGVVVSGQPYQYHVNMILADKAGKTLATEGELKGVWGNPPDGYVMALPEELQAALSSSASAQDLLKDHQPVFVNYHGSLSPDTPLKGTSTGEVVFAGIATLTGGARIRYTIGTLFTLENAHLARWDLNRAKLEQTLAHVVQQPLTQRLIKAKPDIILNLWYAEAADNLATPTPDYSLIYMNNTDGYRITLPACNHTPEVILPARGQPLIAFGYDQGLGPRAPEFVLSEGKPLVNSFEYLFYPPNFGSSVDTLALLRPSEFDTESARPFPWVWYQGSDKITGEPRLLVEAPNDVTNAEMQIYDAIAAKLPVSVSKEGALWTAYGMTFVVDDQGMLQLQACK